MHILVTNDDGPPSDQSSPYVHSLVSTLQKHGHTVSVVLPHTQRSWIGKAHLVGQAIKPTYYRPAPLQTTPDGHLTHHGTTHTSPLPASSTAEEWILVDSTPASCVQIGLYHYFGARGPIDLVVSGPNYGRNSTAVFSLSSGTIGGAMEAAVCGVRSVALSYAFFERGVKARIVEEASELSARLVRYLWDTWDAEAQLYSVNVPLVEGVAGRRVLWTEVLQNGWRSGSCFEVVDGNGEEDEAPAETESKIRSQEEELGRNGSADTSTSQTQPGADNPTAQPHIRFTHKHFKWSPSFKDVYQSVEESSEGNDGWAVANGYTSVTPLRANFMHAAKREGRFEGEIKL